MNSTSSKIRISVDDGCKSDLRLSKLCRKYDIPLTIYLPIEWHGLAYRKFYEPLSMQDVWDLSEFHTFGAHTITHRHLTELPVEDAKYEILYSGIMLENLLGRSVSVMDFAPPRGYTNEELTEYTLHVYGSQRLTKQPGLVHIHPNSGVNDNKPWRECITDKTKELWCHSYELDRFNLWKELEKYLETAHS